MVAGGDRHLGHDAVSRGAELQLHLHRLEQDEDLPGSHAAAWRRLDPAYHARHRGPQHVAPGRGSARPARAAPAVEAVAGAVVADRDGVLIDGEMEDGLDAVEDVAAARARLLDQLEPDGAPAPADRARRPVDDEDVARSLPKELHRQQGGRPTEAPAVVGPEGRVPRLSRKDVRGDGEGDKGLGPFGGQRHAVERVHLDGRPLEAGRGYETPQVAEIGAHPEDGAVVEGGEQALAGGPSCRGGDDDLGEHGVVKRRDGAALADARVDEDVAREPHQARRAGLGKEPRLGVLGVDAGFDRMAPCTRAPPA